MGFRKAVAAVPRIVENQVDPERQDRTETVQDAVFGEVSAGGLNYCTVGTFKSACLMMKAQIGLGVLSIPMAFSAVGMIPGIFLLLVVSAITTWSDYMVGIFKQNHEDVYSVDDAMGEVAMVAGKAASKVAEEFFSAIYVLYWIFVGGSGMQSMSIAFNAISSHATCTAVFTSSAMVWAFFFGSIQTLGKVSWLAMIGLVCILASIFTVTIAVGVQADGPSDWVWYRKPTFNEAIQAVSAIVFAYSGTPAFFNIIAEMKDKPRATVAVLTCQSVVTTIYILIGVVMYYFVGSQVASPALGSAGDVVKKICYGIALPGLSVSTLLFIHFPAKLIFVRLFRGSSHLNNNSLQHWVGWLSCTFSIAVIAYIVANAIPVFNSLVSLVGALLGTLMCFQPMGFMWLYDNWKKGKGTKSRRWCLMVAFSIFVIVAGTFITVAGTMGTIRVIIEEYRATGGSKPWSCVDNSNTKSGH